MVVLPVPGRRLPDTATRTPSTALHLLTLSGKVVDQTGRPVSGVKIAIAGAGAETNGQGVFRLDVKPGVYELRATAPGFHPEIRKLSLQQGAVAPVTLTLRRAEAGPRAPTSRTGAPRKFGEEGSSDDQSFGKPDDSFNK